MMAGIASLGINSSRTEISDGETSEVSFAAEVPIKSENRTKAKGLKEKEPLEVESEDNEDEEDEEIGEDELVNYSFCEGL